MVRQEAVGEVPRVGGLTKGASAAREVHVNPRTLVCDKEYVRGLSRCGTARRDTGTSSPTWRWTRRSASARRRRTWQRGWLGRRWAGLGWGQSASGRLLGGWGLGPVRQWPFAAGAQMGGEDSDPGKEGRKLGSSLVP